VRFAWRERTLVFSVLLLCVAFWVVVGVLIARSVA
jgi:hypothetical protein